MFGISWHGFTNQGKEILGNDIRKNCLILHWHKEM